ncbi:MAG: hypothetical protein AB1810_11725 [Pseudomonadota bacterium]
MVFPPLDRPRNFHPPRTYQITANRSVIDDQLGWASASAMNGSFAFHLNGVMNYFDDTGLRTLIVHHPNGYVVAIAINSKTIDATPSLEQILFDAYDKARGID